MHMLHGQGPLDKCLNARDGPTKDQRVNITLSLICLGYEQIGDVSSNMVLVTCGVTAKDLLESRVTRQHLTKKPLDRRDTYTRAFTSARSQFCRLTIEIISGTALPSSFSRATCVAARVP